MALSRQNLPSKDFADSPYRKEKQTFLWDADVTTLACRATSEQKPCIPKRIWGKPFA